MIKVLFVCLGNICRSPMAEGLFRKRVNDEGLSDKIFVESRATSSYETGNEPHFKTKDLLVKEGAYYDDMRSQKITMKDIESFDFIIGMDESNIKNLRKIAGHHYHKIYKYLDVCETCLIKEIADPYYTDRFDVTHKDIMKAIDQWMEIFKKYLS
jgi:protein-tyrosine phosphatase